MGRMLRMRDWNLGVLPSPFPDQGLEIDGTHWFGDRVQLDYATYAVAGFKGDTTSTDLDFTRSRAPYYVDNNTLPTVGGRLALTAKLGANSDVTLGASGQYGAFDPNHQLAYAIVGADLAFRFARTNLRFEWLTRWQQFDVSDPSRFKYVASATSDSFLKHGAYVELEVPVGKTVDLIGRIDGLYRVGNLPIDSALSYRSSVVRATVGTSIAVERNLRLKASTELWRFSDQDGDGHTTALSVHAGVVATF
jgi:hypothetical protein